MRMTSVFLLGSLCIATSALAQAPATTAAPGEGTPITDPVVVKSCGGCHTPDAQQRLSRISFQRIRRKGGRTPSSGWSR